MFVVNLISFVVLRKITTAGIDTSLEEAEPSQNQPESEICDENTYTSEQYVILKRTGMNNAELSNTLLGILVFHLYLWIFQQ